MALTVEINHPDFPDGTIFGIVGLGSFRNGEAREVTESEERAFCSFYQADAKEKLSESEVFNVTGTATVKDLEEILGKDVSDRPSSDPTAMNLDPKTGEVFEFANLGGMASDPEVPEVEVAPPTTPGTIVEDGDTFEITPVNKEEEDVAVVAIPSDTIENEGGGT